MDTEISIVAVRQHGNVTRQQLLALGLDDNAIRHRVKLGRLHRHHPGIYAVGRPPRTVLERAAAAVLACGPGAALSHASALALWGFTKSWPERFEVTVLTDRRPNGITVHRSATLQRRDLTRHYGIRVTTPARTLLDCAQSLTDRALTRAVNEALLSNYLKRSHLAELLARAPNHRGAGRLMPYVTAPNGPTRSEFEDAFPIFCERFGLPRPELNAKVAGYEVDALFKAEKLIVELDSYRWHSTRDSFERDRDRDADTLAAGFQTVRITWARIRQTPRKEAARLHAILRTRRLGV